MKCGELCGAFQVSKLTETQARRLFKVAITETDFRLCHVRNELHKSAGLIDK